MMVDEDEDSSIDDSSEESLPEKKPENKIARPKKIASKKRKVKLGKFARPAKKRKTAATPSQPPGDGGPGMPIHPDDDVPLIALLPKACPAPDSQANVSRRSKIGEPWGPFWIAPVSRRGKVIAYGGTCKKHVAPGDAKDCKKQVTLSRCGNDETRCRTAIKAWLYLGHFMSACDLPRKAHIDMDALEASEGYDEAALDDLVLGLL